MKVMILSGSRNPDGQTARGAAAFARGLSEGGHETETVFLPARSIERCRQCDNDGCGGGAPACIVQLEKITARCGFDAADLVPVRRQNLEFKTGILNSTGAWFASLLKA